MFALYKHVCCPKCHGHHDVCLHETGPVLLNDTLEFICPMSGHKASLRSDIYSQPVRKFPTSAIPLYHEQSLQEVSQ